MNKPTGSNSYRDTLTKKSLTVKERARDIMINDLVVWVNNHVTVEQSFEFLADRDACADKREVLAVCRLWEGRVFSGQSEDAEKQDAVNALLLAIENQKNAPNAQVFQLRTAKAAHKAEQAGVEVKYSKFGQIVSVDGVQVAETADLLPDLRMDLMAREPLNRNDGRLSPEYAKRARNGRNA